MKFLGFVVKSAFLTGALTAGAFITGAAIGTVLNKEKIINKIKKVQLKKIIQLQLNNLEFLFFIIN